MTTTRTTILTRLLDAPHALASAEHEALSAHCRLAAAREDLADGEARLILGEGLTGKNAEVRAAQLRALTMPLREAVQEAQEEAQLAAVRLRVVQAEFSGLRAAAKLVGGMEEDENA